MLLLIDFTVINSETCNAGQIGNRSCVTRDKTKLNNILNYIQYLQFIYYAVATTDNRHKQTGCAVLPQVSFFNDKISFTADFRQKCVPRCTECISPLKHNIGTCFRNTDVRS